MGIEIYMQCRKNGVKIFLKYETSGGHARQGPLCADVNISSCIDPLNYEIFI